MCSLRWSTWVRPPRVSELGFARYASRLSSAARSIRVSRLAEAPAESDLAVAVSRCLRAWFHCRTAKLPKTVIAGCRAGKQESDGSRPCGPDRPPMLSNLLAGENVLRNAVERRGELGDRIAKSCVAQ